MKITKIVLDTYDGQTAGDYIAQFYCVRVHGEVTTPDGETWHCERLTMGGEHWYPAAERAADEATARFGVEWETAEDFTL